MTKVSQTSNNFKIITNLDFKFIEPCRIYTYEIILPGKTYETSVQHLVDLLSMNGGK